MGAAVLTILAITAVPVVVSQARSAGDTRAKAAVTRLATQVEACRVAAASYGECDERSELDADRAVHWGRGAGDAGVLADRSEERAFTAYAISGSGSRVYVWTSRDSRVTKRVCRHDSVPPLERDGCDDSGW